jgi:hypothetical protein
MNPALAHPNNLFTPVSSVALNETSATDPVLNSGPTVDPSLSSLFDFNLNVQPASLTSVPAGN